MKLPKIFTNALLYTVFCCGSAQAVTTFGTYDCGEWFKKTTAKPWLLGFLSGFNAMASDDKKNYDPLKKLNSAEQAFLWMDNYCRNNPLENVTSGAIDLYIELQKK